MANPNLEMVFPLTHYFKSALEEALIEEMLSVFDGPDRILKSGPCTIVFWNDGTKTIVKRSEDDAEDDYSAFTAALAKKVYGSTSAVKRIVERTEKQKEKKQKETKEVKEAKSRYELGKAMAEGLLKAIGAWQESKKKGDELPRESEEKS